MTLVTLAPQFTPQEAMRLAQELYGLEVQVQPLPSERDQNFHLLTAHNQSFVLKIANPNEDYSLLEAQNQVMNRVAERQVADRRPLLTQTVRPTLNGEQIAVVQRQEQQHAVRLLSWLPGTPLGAIRHQSPALLADLGGVMGEIDRALAGFVHPALRRDFHWDVANAVKVIHAYKAEIVEPRRRALIERFLSRFERSWSSMFSQLRPGVIHGDANDYNILVDPGDMSNPFSRYQRLSGVLDFGDMVESYLACEPAIAAAYALLDKEEPLAAAAAVVRGYHAVNPLNESEIAALWDLTCARLCMSVCHAAHQRAAQPDNDYLSISERPALAALAKLDAIHPRLAWYTLRDACDLAPCPQAATVSDFLRKNQSTFAKIIEPDPATAPAVYVDLSVASPLLSLIGTTGDSTTQLSRLIEQQIAAAGAEFGFGGYNEPRLVYAGPAFGSAEGPTAERRTVHLGLDLFLPAGAPVYAPLAGRVFAFHNNDARYDYGPVIMLEHHCDDGTPFYTLYGHLSPESLTGLHLGQPVAAGQRLGWLGAPPINGDWPPHLHFQIILDDLGQSYDYIGVARASQRSFWLGLSPDPNLIVGIPAERFPPSRPNKAETLANRRQRIGRSLSIAYQEPLKIVRGRRQYLYDETGRAYLDGVNNVCHVGHCHPQVAAAGQRQMATLNTNTRYLHDSINEFARRLCATLPEPLSVCFFVCSGSEANDLALRLARSYTGQFDMICVEAGYHGHTQALIDISPYKHNGPGGRGRPSWVQMATMPDPYRGAYKGYGEEAGRAYADDVRRAVNDIQRQGRGVAGFICESMIGCGGQIVLPAGYMAEAFRHVRAAGGLCIADEVQVGFGRVGTHFWGFQTQDVIPDIVSMGKPIGNGHPLAAVITTPAIAEAFANGMEYFSTFGGNPVSCEIGLAVLDVIEQEGLQANALAVGQRLMAGARGLMARYPLIGDVRGLGLYIGIELVLDRATLQPAGEHAAYISNRMKEYGVLVSTDGPYHNVLKIKPPIVWTDADADHCIATLERVLAEEALAV